MKTKAFRAALPYTLPICVGFLFLGMSYGFLMRSQGFSFVYPMLMSLFIFAGSMEFVTANLLLMPTFQPLHAFLLTLMVNARHLFYGLSMLDKFQNLGWKKPYLIFGLCDETFSIHCAVPPPEGVDRGWFMFFVTVLNQLYWVAGATLGALLGYLIHFNTTGIEFVMTALFVVMFLNQWEERKDHRPALIGVGCTLLCLLVLGSDHFLLPAMGLIILCFLWLRRRSIIDEGQETVQLSDDPRNVFSVGNQETMEGILIIVRMRQTGQEILGLWCTGQLFGQTAKLRCSNPDEPLWVHGWKKFLMKISISWVLPLKQTAQDDRFLWM